MGKGKGGIKESMMNDDIESKAFILNRREEMNSSRLCASCRELLREFRRA